MVSRLGDTFVRSVIKKVEDCSTPIQLRAYLSKYEDYVFSEKISKVFLSRLEFFKDKYKFDTIEMSAIEDIEELLETNIQIGKLNGRPKDGYAKKKHFRALDADEDLGVSKL